MHYVAKAVLFFNKLHFCVILYIACTLNDGIHVLNEHDFRAEIALTDGRLMGVIRELNVTADLDKALKQDLTALEKELKDLNNTLHQLRGGLENYVTAGMAGKLVFLIEYYANTHMKSKLTNENDFVPKNK